MTRGVGGEGGAAGGRDPNAGGRGDVDRGRRSDGISNAERLARQQYSQSMQQAGMANLAGPPGFSKAVDRYNNRSGMWDVLDWIGGPFIDVNKPQTNVPQSYRNSDWHTSTNPGGVLGSLAGGAALPGLGMFTGWLGSKAWNSAGLPQMWHGGGMASGVPGGVQTASGSRGPSLGGGKNEPGFNGATPGSPLGLGNPTTPQPTPRPTGFQRPMNFGYGSFGGINGSSWTRPGYSFMR